MEARVAMPTGVAITPLEEFLEGWTPGCEEPRYGRFEACLRDYEDMSGPAWCGYSFGEERQINRPKLECLQVAGPCILLQEV